MERASPKPLPAGIQCYKMHGSGNDFVLFDNTVLGLAPELMPAWAQKVCHRGFGIGADGLIFLDQPRSTDEADYVWHFYNADGSRAEMCGNGSRCAARLAWQLGMAGPEHVLGTDAGPIKAAVLSDNERVKVQLTPYRDLRLDLSLDLHGVAWSAHFVNTGVPHVVIFVEDVAGVDVQATGKAFRNHPLFAPAGANVNFVQIKDRNSLLLRTYERGVEAETLACGTGAAAAALISHLRGLTAHNVLLRTSGNEELGIDIQERDIFLTGQAMLVFTARLFPQSLGLQH